MKPTSPEAVPSESLEDEKQRGLTPERESQWPNERGFIGNYRKYTEHRVEGERILKMAKEAGRKIFFGLDWHNFEQMWQSGERARQSSGEQAAIKKLSSLRISQLTNNPSSGAGRQEILPKVRVSV